MDCAMTITFLLYFLCWPFKCASSCIYGLPYRSPLGCKFRVFISFLQIYAHVHIYGIRAFGVQAILQIHSIHTATCVYFIVINLQWYWTNKWNNMLLIYVFNCFIWSELFPFCTIFFSLFISDNDNCVKCTTWNAKNQLPCTQWVHLLA